MNKISVICPTHNRIRYLQAAIKSCMDQEYPNLEIIVVDNGTTDGTKIWLKALKCPYLSVISIPDTTAPKAVNEGIRHATGDLVTILCDDDMLLPGSLEYRARAFDYPVGIEVVWSGWKRMNQAGETDGQTHFFEGVNAARIWSNEYVSFPTMMWKRSIHERLGFFPENIQFQVDRWFKICCLMECNCAGLPEATVLYRIWGGQETARGNHSGEMQREAQVVYDMLKARYKL